MELLESSLHMTGVFSSSFAPDVLNIIKIILSGLNAARLISHKDILNEIQSERPEMDLCVFQYLTNKAILRFLLMQLNVLPQIVRLFKDCIYRALQI